MPRNVKKEHLPTKICVVCNRPFTWRKKWERVWDEVSTCSKSCNKKRKAERQKHNIETRLEIKNEIENNNILDEENGALIPNFHMLELDDEIMNFESSPNVNENLRSEDSLSDNNDFQLENVDDIGFDGVIKKDRKSNEAREERKRAKKLAKAQRRAQRQGKGDPSAGQKPCDVCGKSVDLLIRCTIDESKSWKFVCGKCWKKVSGGVQDGDASHPYYRYGGLWKNRRAKT